MRAPSLAGLVTLLLGACPPSQSGETTGTASTGAASSSSTAPASTGAPTTSGGTTDASTSVSTGPDTSTSSASTADTSATDASATDASSSTSTTGASSSGGDGTTGGGGQYFPCDTCFCDAAVSYCRIVQAGVLPVPPDPVLCPIVPPDDYLTGCVLYPQSCGDTPTCDCIPTQNNTCFCNEDMGTFTATCPLP